MAASQLRTRASCVTMTIVPRKIAGRNYFNAPRQQRVTVNTVRLVEDLSVPLQNPKSKLISTMFEQLDKHGGACYHLALDATTAKVEGKEVVIRVSILNFYGNIVFDTLIKPEVKTLDEVDC